MYKKQIAGINDSIRKTKKAIISIGCSFVQGQGAVNNELYTDYKWSFDGLGIPLYLTLPPDEETALMKKYPSVIKKDGTLNFRFMEYENAFVNVLCKKYFNGEYTPINLGLAGCGNRGSIKELYFYPQINWHEVEEFIVVYCPSGPERFDFINDQWNDHGHWVAMWPHYKDQADGPRKSLWQGYNDCLHSDKFEVLEQIAHIQELMLWCKHHGNARLIITPGFDHRYDKDHFIKSLDTKIAREMNGTLIKENKMSFFNNISEVEEIVNMWPWDSMFKPAGQPTFADCVVAREKKQWGKTNHFFNYLGTGSPEGWITACAHPSAKGHDYFAELLYKEITGIK
jgi:hypothetical protein